MAGYAEGVPVPTQRRPTPGLYVADMMPAPGAIDLYWIPLGAGGQLVRLNGKVYEGIKAFIEHRPRFALYHTAIEVGLPDGRYVIESAPIRDGRGRERGVVVEGPVGMRWAGRFRLLRYEIRRWQGGSIPDSNEAVSSPVRVANDLARAQRVLDLVPSVPTPVWGRDDLHTGDMWNSNSLTSWLLARAGVDTEPIQPPSGGERPVGTPVSWWRSARWDALRPEGKRFRPTRMWPQEKSATDQGEPCHRRFARDAQVVRRTRRSSVFDAAVITHASLITLPTVQKV